MSSVIYLMIGTAAISASIFICLGKWGVIEFYQVHRPKWFPADVCDFCFCFWCSLIQVIYLSFDFDLSHFSEIFYIAVPLGAASIGKMIINIARGHH